MVIIFFCALATFVYDASAQTGNASIGKIVNVIGSVDIIRGSKTLSASKGFQIYESDELVTHAKTVVKMLFNDESSVIAFENTRVKISEYKLKNKQNGGSILKSTIDMAVGKMRAFVKNLG